MNVTFEKNGQRINIQTTDDEIFPAIALKYCSKIGIDSSQLEFFLNSKKLGLNSPKTLKELNINNGTVIRVVGKGNQNEIKYINVVFAVIGRSVMVQGQTNMKFSDLVKKFCTKADVKDTDQPIYILNSQKISPDDSRTLGELNLRDHARIEVTLSKDVIGAL